MYRLSVASGWITSQYKTGTDAIEFVIKPLADYLDIKKTELRMVLKITKRNGTPTGDGKKYTLINNALHSIIKQFTIKINKTLMTEQSDTQAYNAYIKTILNFTEQAKSPTYQKLCTTKTQLDIWMKWIILPKIISV